jgi:hypothetical protein
VAQKYLGAARDHAAFARSERPGLMFHSDTEKSAVR